MLKKVKYLMLSMALFLFPTINVLAEVTYSYRDKEKNIVYIVGIALLIIRIAVPIILMVMASIDLIRAMTQTDEREMKKVINSIIPKVISAIIVFLLPSVLALVLKLINQDSLWSEYSQCLLKPFSCNVQLWDK